MHPIQQAFCERDGPDVWILAPGSVTSRGGAPREDAESFARAGCAAPSTATSAGAAPTSASWKPR